MNKLLTKKDMKKQVNIFLKEDKKRRKLLSHKVFDTFRRAKKSMKNENTPDFIIKAYNESFWELLNGKNKQ